MCNVRLGGEQAQYMAVDFAADMQQELDYFALPPPTGMGVDGIFSDCPRTTREWINSQCAFCHLLAPTQVPLYPVFAEGPHLRFRLMQEASSMLRFTAFVL
jgi:hypothetical protein